MRLRRKLSTSVPAHESSQAQAGPRLPPITHARCVVKGLMLSTAKGFPEVVLEQMAPQDKRQASIVEVEQDAVHADYRRTVTAIPLFELEIQMRASLQFDVQGEELSGVPADALLGPVLSLCDPHSAELVAVVTSRMGLPPLILAHEATAVPDGR